MSLIPIDQRPLVLCSPSERPVACRALSERLAYLEAEIAACRHRALEIDLHFIAAKVATMTPIVREVVADLRRCPR